MAASALGTVRDPQTVHGPSDHWELWQ